MGGAGAEGRREGGGAVAEAGVVMVQRTAGDRETEGGDGGARGGQDSAAGPAGAIAIGR